MSVSIVLAPGALEDLERHREFYASVSEALADRFLDAFLVVADRLGDFPLSAASIARAPRFRRALLREFPVSFIYEFREGTVRILALPHHRQDSDAWRID